MMETHHIKQNWRNRIIFNFQKFLRKIDLIYKLEQKLYGYLEPETS